MSDETATFVSWRSTRIRIRGTEYEADAEHCFTIPATDAQAAIADPSLLEILESATDPSGDAKVPKRRAKS